MNLTEALRFLTLAAEKGHAGAYDATGDFLKDRRSRDSGFRQSLALV